MVHVPVLEKQREPHVTLNSHRSVCKVREGRLPCSIWSAAAEGTQGHRRGEVETVPSPCSMQGVLWLWPMLMALF